MPTSLDTRMTIPTVSVIASPFFEHLFDNSGWRRHGLPTSGIRIEAT